MNRGARRAVTDQAVAFSRAREFSMYVRYELSIRPAGAGRSGYPAR